MIPAFRFEKVMCRRDLSSMYLIWIFLRPFLSMIMAPVDPLGFLLGPGCKERKSEGHHPVSSSARAEGGRAGLALEPG